MKAAVCRTFGAPLQVEEISLDAPTKSEVRVKLKACAICHSDIMYVDGHWGGDLPAVFGHEASGIVESTGPDVKNVSVGDHVVVTLIRSCGKCHTCEHVNHALCEAEFSLSGRSPLADRNGNALTHGLGTAGFAEEVLVDASQVCKIPDDIPFDAASLLACGVLTGFGAVTKTARVPAGSSVVVIGCGGVGLNAIQGAVHSDAACIVAVDVVPGKLEAAMQFGATHGINAKDDDVVDQLRAITSQRGADYVFVTAGSKQAIDVSVSMLAKGGTAVIVGMPAIGVEGIYDPGTLAAWSQKIIGSKMGTARIAVDIPALVQLYQDGELKLDELISGRFPLDKINEAIAASRSGDALRNVIVF